MAFIKEHCDPKRLVDNVFGIVNRMKEDEKKYGKGNSINCSVGSLKNEDDVLVAYKVVYSILFYFLLLLIISIYNETKLIRHTLCDFLKINRIV